MDFSCIQKGPGHFTGPLKLEIDIFSESGTVVFAVEINALPTVFLTAVVAEVREGGAFLRQTELSPALDDLADHVDGSADVGGDGVILSDTLGIEHAVDERDRPTESRQAVMRDEMIAQRIMRRVNRDCAIHADIGQRHQVAQRARPRPRQGIVGVTVIVEDLCFTHRHGVISQLGKRVGRTAPQHAEGRGGVEADAQLVVDVVVDGTLESRE